MRAFSKSVVLLATGAMVAAAQRTPVKLPAKPEVTAPKQVVYPKFTLDSLANGLRFAVIENHELPLVVVQTDFAGAGPLASSFLDSPDKAGAWGLMLTLLREGTSTRTLAQLTDEALDLGTDLRLPAPPVFSPPWFRAARSTWKPSLAIVADLLMNPAFPEAGFARLKTLVSTQLDRSPPAAIINRVMYAQLYGAEDLYRRFATSATLAGVTRDDLVALQQKYLRPQNTVVVIAGDVTAAEARTVMQSTFGSWARGGTTVTRTTLTAPATPTPTTIYLKDSPGLAQSSVSAGMLVPGRNSSDAAALDALASVLGDFSVSAGSRVYNAFRIERGLSYSPSVFLAPRPVPEMAPLIARAQVAPAVTDTAVMMMVKVFRELRQEKPATAGELDFSKRALLGQLPAALEQLDRVGATVLASIADGLPANYLNTWVQRIGGLGLPEVQAAAAKYLDADHLTIAVLGDRTKVEAALRATGIPVVIVP